MVFVDLIRNDSQHINAGITKTGHFQSLVRKFYEYTVAYETVRPPNFYAKCHTDYCGLLSGPEVET